MEKEGNYDPLFDPTAMSWSATWLAIVLVALVAAVFVVILIYSNAERAENKANWLAWEQAMTKGGCKVTSFTGSRYTRAIWTCPDGHAELGRYQ